MGRQTRQSRRAQERRATQHQKARPLARKSGPNWPLIIGGLIVLAVAAILGTMAVNGSSSASGTPTPINVTGPSVAGIGCQSMEQGSYHVHAHLTVIDHGKPVVFSADSGHNYNNDCLYWLHAHDTVGILHVESPQEVHPPLSAWYKILGLPLTKTQIGTAKVKSGDTVKAWVNMKPYHGNIGQIKISAHTDITIEVGPPFSTPKKFPFAKYNV
jgi:hypothetical protein